MARPARLGSAVALLARSTGALLLLPLLAGLTSAQPAPTPPVVHIVQPAPGARFFVGDAITLQATAIDGTGTDLGTGIAWDSDLAGGLGTGSLIVTTLPLGTQVVRASVTDSRGARATDQITLDVVARPAGNSEPLVTITAPGSSAALAAGPPIAFRGSATDLEDGALTPGLVWTSDRDGALGTGGSFTHPLSQGLHHITATASDRGGLAGSATLVVQVGPPVTLEFIPAADSYVDAAAPAVAFGTSPTLRVDANTTRQTYLRFAVGGVGPRAVLQATLRLQVDPSAGSESNSGGTVYAVSDNTWQERTVTYATRPPLAGPALASTGPVARGQLVDFDLGSAVAGDGTYSFAIVNTSSDEATYRSREGGPPPRLILTLAGNPPAVVITTPAAAAGAHRGDTVTFTGRATDTEDGDLSGGLQWTSSRDGVLGTGASISTSTLSLGTHTVTATAVDTESAVGAAQVQVTIYPSSQTIGPPPTTPPDQLPVVAIGAPANGTTLLTGKPVVLAGTASDAEDGDLEDVIRWTSSRDGALGNGSSLTIPSLSVGTHVLTATVADHAGMPAGASVTVTVIPPVLSFFPTADAYVDAGSADVSFGGATGLLTSGAPVSRQIFLRFAVSGVERFAVQQARLRLTAASGGGDGSVAGGTLRSVSDTSWPETITYRSRPTIDGPLLGSQGAVAPSQVVDFDVTRAVAGDGPYAFALLSTAGDDVRYASREAASGRPELILTLAQSTPPVVTIRTPLMDTAVEIGTAVGLAGSARDAEGVDLSDRLQWTSNLDGPLGIGSAMTAGRLSLGTHLITAGVLDAEGLAGQALTTVQVHRPNTAPKVTIVTPASATLVPAGTSIRFAAVVSDDIDINLGARLSWTSSRDGSLGTGNARSVTLSPGAHTISATVTDSGGLTGSAAITVTVNAAPTIAITSPAGGATAVPGEMVTLAASARDAEDGDLASRVTWRSSLDGLVGIGSPLAVGTLRSGSHILTASVSDNGGTSVSTAVVLLVNSIPSVTITAPAPGSRFAPGDAVTLAASAVDLEDGDLGARISWSSSLNGPLGTGATVTVSTLSPGTHVLTAAVTDSGGRTSRATVTLSPFACLVQSGPLVTLSGTSATSYSPSLLAAATRIDARTAVFLASPSNRYPLNLTGGPGACVEGGVVLGQYDRTATWDQMHYANNNAGVAFDDDHLSVDGLRVDNVTDGIRPRGGDDFTIRNVRLSYMRDDCIENDHVHGGLVDDSLLDGCYVAFSARPSPAIIDSGYSGAGKVWTIDHSLVRLQPMPGPDGPSADGLGTGGFFKWHLWEDPANSLSPKLELHDNIFMAERAGVVSPDRMGIPPGQLAGCSNNVMVWLGDGSYPATLPSCFTITTDRRVWDNAVADWERRHPQVPR
jgi:hypothetical protein